MYIHPRKYLKFYDAALKVDHTYHRARKDLWDLFVESFSAFHQPGYVPIITSRFNALKTYLCSRNDTSNSDDKRLAFEVALVSTFESVLDTVNLQVEPSVRRQLRITAPRLGTPPPRVRPLNPRQNEEAEAEDEEVVNEDEGIEAEDEVASEGSVEEGLRPRQH